MADGLTLRVQDKRGALAISPTIVILIGKHGVFHSSLILLPDVDDPVGVVSEEPLRQQGLSVGRLGNKASV